jgi:hypothetical protein
VICRPLAAARFLARAAAPDGFGWLARYQLDVPQSQPAGCAEFLRQLGANVHGDRETLPDRASGRPWRSAGIALAALGEDNHQM